MNSIVRGIINFLIGVISGATEEAQKNTATAKASQRQSSKKSTPKPRSSTSSSTHSGSQHHYEDPATANRPKTSICEASIADALAHASYTPVMDGDADPGEVVWTWVPFEEDYSQGKDRPVLIVGRDGDWLLGLMLTSQDHDDRADREHREGRWWCNIGSGDWDSRHRDSEVRTDRILRVDPDNVRRLAGRLAKDRFDVVAAEVDRHWND